MSALMQEGCGLWWLSFVDVNYETNERVFLGIVIVAGTSQFDAVASTWAMGINPGGEVLPVGPFPPHAIEDKFLNRLLTKEEAHTIPEPTDDWFTYYQASHQKETS